MTNEKETETKKEIPKFKLGSVSRVNIKTSYLGEDLEYQWLGDLQVEGGGFATPRTLDLAKGQILEEVRRQLKKDTVIVAPHYVMFSIAQDYPELFDSLKDELLNRVYRMTSTIAMRQKGIFYLGVNPSFKENEIKGFEHKPIKVGRAIDDKPVRYLNPNTRWPALKGEEFNRSISISYADEDGDYVVSMNFEKNDNLSICSFVSIADPVSYARVPLVEKIA